MAFFAEYKRPAKRPIPRRSKNRPTLPSDHATESQSQSVIEGGRGSAKPGAATTSIDPHPQVLVNQLDKQFPPPGVP
jgi:hypothetical protein